jgi:signal transduction histidine kinase
VLGYLGAVGTQSLRLWADPGLTPRQPWWDEAGGGARPTAEAIGTTALAVLIAGMFAIVLFRWLRTRRAHRRGAQPIWAYVVVAAVLGFTVTVSSFSPLPTSARLAFTAVALDLVLIALLVIPVLRRQQGWQVIRRLLADRDPRAEPGHAGADGDPPTASLAGLQTTLRQVLDDPELMLYLTEGDVCRDVHGRAVVAPSPEPGRVDRPVRWQGRRVALIRLHDVWRESDPVLTAALNSVGIAVEALRLEGVASRQALEVARSRQRLVTTALYERRRIERDLHDSIQNMLFSVLTMIDNAEHHIAEGRDPDAAQGDLRRAHARLSATISEMRRLVRGLYPATLANHGLAAAVEELCDTCPIPAVVDVRCAGWPSTVEATAYFIIAECLTNAVKHATATAVTVHVGEDRGSALIVVRDNGNGGVRLDPDGGLQHLHDRVAALGGELSAEGTPSRGTAVTARLPIADV